VEARRPQDARRCRCRSHCSQQVQPVAEPVVVRAAEPEHARPLAGPALPPGANAERRPEAQLVEQLEARPVSARPQEATQRHFVRRSSMQPMPESDAAEPLAVAAPWAWSHSAAARAAAGQPQGAPEAVRWVWRWQALVSGPLATRVRAGRCRRRRPVPVAADAAGSAGRQAQDWKPAQTPDVRIRAAVADPSRCRRAADFANSPPFPRSHERKSPRPERITGERAHARLCIVADFSPTAHDYCTRVPLSPHRDMKTKYGERVIPVSRTRSSHECAADTIANFGFKGTLAS